MASRPEFGYVGRSGLVTVENMKRVLLAASAAVAAFLEDALPDAGDGALREFGNCD
jgi:hypothetical protein